MAILLSEFLNAYPVFDGHITQGQFSQAECVAELFFQDVCLGGKVDNEKALKVMRMLTIAHLLSIECQGGNPIKRHETQESATVYETWRTTASVTEFRQTAYGRMLEDLLNVCYQGGMVYAFRTLPCF
jgi:hypothetical protein